MLKEGIPAWEEKGFALYVGPDYEKRNKNTYIPVKELRAMMKKKPRTFVLLDVREAHEYAAGHLSGAINIPVTKFAAAAKLDRGRKVVIYCRSGARSYTAYRKLKKLGFPDVWQITFEDWQEAGFPIEK